jgi:hypothetical protein
MVIERPGVIASLSNKYAYYQKKNCTSAGLRFESAVSVLPSPTCYRKMHLQFIHMLFYCSHDAREGGMQEKYR